MRVTSILSEEHRVIEVMLSVLERMSQEALQKQKLDRESAKQAIDFIRNFADKCHHGKEEDHLFTTLVDKGMPGEGGPVGQMLHEHEIGRNLVRGMADSLESAADGEVSALNTFADSARGYIELLRAHIQKEDGILFPMADRLLSADDQSVLLQSFEQTESEHMGHGTHDKYLQIAQQLAEKYDVPSKAIDANTHSCGCEHH